MSDTRAAAAAVGLAEKLAHSFAERAAAHDDDASFPAADWEDLRASGLLGLLVPARLGGLGAGFLDYVRVATALAAGSPATALLFNMHASVTGALASVPDEAARGLGAPETFFAARDRVLRAAVDGAAYGVAITEPAAGSRLSAMASTYEREGEGYRLRGDKSVCSGVGHLDGYLFAARGAGTDSDAEDPRVSYFLLPASADLKVDDTWNPLGMRATASNGFTVETWVPADALVGGVEGLAVLLAYALPQWLVASYAAVYVGLAEGAVHAAVDHVGRRSVRHAGASEPARGGLADIGWVRARIGRADTQAAAARAVLEEAARRVDTAPGEAETNRWVYRAKLIAGDVAQDVAASLVEACGLGVLRRGSPLERALRDARNGALMPPSSDLCADVLGVVALGMDPVNGPGARPW